MSDVGTREEFMNLLSGFEATGSDPYPALPQLSFGFPCILDPTGESASGGFFMNLVDDANEIRGSWRAVEHDLMSVFVDVHATGGMLHQVLARDLVEGWIRSTPTPSVGLERLMRLIKRSGIALSDRSQAVPEDEWTPVSASEGISADHIRELVGLTSSIRAKELPADFDDDF